MNTQDGFDYRIQKPVTKSAHDWRADLNRVVNDGGFRRVENGETFGHDARGKMLFEVYDRVRL